MKKGLPIVIALVVTVVSGASAYALNTVLGGLVAPDETPAATVASAAPPAQPVPVRSRLKTIEQYLDVIINQNLFDLALHGTFGPRDPKGGELAKATIDVVLLGTIVAEPETFSSALIVEKGREDWPMGYSIGDELFGREVVKIEKKRVALKKPDGTIEWLTVDESVTRPAPEPKSGGGESDEGISQTDDNRFAVDKELFDKYINDIESISRMGRALLHRGPDGEFDGYRLSAIRRNTLADQLGIKNGDVVHTVNGTELNSVQSAMNAYQTLQNEASFCFEITRRGQPMELCYDVQ